MFRRWWYCMQFDLRAIGQWEAAAATVANVAINYVCTPIDCGSSQQCMNVLVPTINE